MVDEEKQESSSDKPCDGPDMTGPQPFIMIRHGDETGVSGTGPVLEGTVYSDGSCTTRWLSGRPGTTTWNSFAAFKEVHILPHPTNNTEIVWPMREMRKELEMLKALQKTEEEEPEA